MCDKNNIYLIEDAAESLGSVYRATKSGKTLLRQLHRKLVKALKSMGMSNKELNQL